MKEEYKGTTKLYSRCTEVEAVVLANGEYPTASLPCIYWKAPLMWFCCDGGADEYIRQGHIPNLIIGDGDSICEENRRKYGHLLHCSSEQETNDQTKSRQLLIVTRETPDSHRGRHRQTRRPYFWEISACLWTTCVPEPMYVLIQTMAFSSPCRDTCPPPAGRGSRYLSSTSARRLHGIGLVYPPSATAPTGGKALSTNVPALRLQSKAEGEYLLFPEFPH